MYLIIVGLGGIGRSLAGIASENGHSVVVIDRDEERCAEILTQYDLLAIAGNATDKAVLEDAGVDRADALVATTSDDALNLMACWLAKRYNV
ncbi:MAG TPA: TrkA family potassium uptake protein, partial [Methanocorpusculum sp.]|nr:TrkA family potassium uptake protein [Methanocorpusculum sp.]